jgi:hypothetical protein
MSSIQGQGIAGTSPEGIPNSREDGEMNPEGVTPSGQTVSFTSIDSSESAAGVQQVALPIIQSDDLVSSPILGGAIGEIEVADMVAEVVEKNESNVQQLDEDLDALFQAIDSSEEQLESLEMKNKSALKGIRHSSNRQGMTRNKSSNASSEYTRLANIRASLRSTANRMRHHAGLVTSSLADLQKQLRSLSQKDLETALGKDSEAILSHLRKLGLDVNKEGEWKLRSNGDIGRLNQSIHDLSLLVEHLNDEGILSLDKEASKKEVNTCCSLSKAYQFLQEHLMSALRTVYLQILRFLNWISRKIGVGSKRTDDYYTRPGVFTNPYASYLGANPPINDPRSLRDRLRGDGALSGDDTLFSMPQDDSVDSESVSDDDRGSR